MFMKLSVLGVSVYIVMFVISSFSIFLLTNMQWTSFLLWSVLSWNSLFLKLWYLLLHFSGFPLYGILSPILWFFNLWLSFWVSMFLGNYIPLGCVPWSNLSICVFWLNNLNCSHIKLVQICSYHCLIFILLIFLLFSFCLTAPLAMCMYSFRLTGIFGFIVPSWDMFDNVLQLWISWGAPCGSNFFHHPSWRKIIPGT